MFRSEHPYSSRNPPPPRCWHLAYLAQGLSGNDAPTEQDVIPNKAPATRRGFCLCVRCAVRAFGKAVQIPLSEGFMAPFYPRAPWYWHMKRSRMSHSLKQKSIQPGACLSAISVGDFSGLSLTGCFNRELTHAIEIVAVHRP